MSKPAGGINLTEFGLRIDSPKITPSATNFRPPSWPPHKDWPVVVGEDGECLSRYGDPVWRLDRLAGRPMRLNFGDGPHCSSIDPINSLNANLLRLVVAFWLWGPFAVYSCLSLKAKFNSIRRIFVLSSQEGISAADLMRFPLVADKIPSLVSGNKVTVDGFFTNLHDLYTHRDFLGFTLLDREGLRHLAAAMEDGKDYEQRAYIPPRIQMYQVARLRECLDEFLQNQERIIDCYQFCLDAYAFNAGTLEQAISDGWGKQKVTPFDAYKYRGGTALKFYGPFEITAGIFGIHELLERWNGPLGDGTASGAVKSLTDYLRIVSFAGLAYVLNFSLMRIQEAWDLRADCYTVERDEKFGEISILRGETTKTQSDSDARWPTSPSVKVAIDAMSIIARLKLRCASAHPKFSRFNEDFDNPYLMARSFEPWRNGGGINVEVRPMYRAYMNSPLFQNPLFFDRESLRITAEDLSLARLITPTLNTEKFQIGKVWPLSWHQLRRTGSVNMQSSGLVSELSLQYLLKHRTLPMALYYGQNHSRLRLNEQARTTYLKAMYEVVGLELARLGELRFFSPHGERRKAEILKLISQKDAKQLSEAVKRGEITAPREIILGYCMRREICPWGGIDSIAHCGGGDSDSPCSHVLYDTRKIRIVEKLDDQLGQQLRLAPIGSPIRQSLEYQMRSAKNYLNACKSSS